MPPDGEPHGSGLNLTLLKNMSVIIIEDVWQVANALQSTLQKLGMRVIGPTATTAEARRLVSMQKPQLALVDINLKNESASEIIDELNGQGVPIIVVSGYAAPPIDMKKAAAFVQKPFSGKELIATMCDIVGRLGLSE
jgi:DNA-binding response OmpR family regulator